MTVAERVVPSIIPSSPKDWPGRRVATCSFYFMWITPSYFLHVFKLLLMNTAFKGAGQGEAFLLNCKGFWERFSEISRDSCKNSPRI
jgi:hypothetical protein